MSRDDRDKRGGHARRRSDFDFRCCDLARQPLSRSRTRRNSAMNQHDRRAEGSS